MAKDLKQIVQEEYIKCAKDPVHFMRKYCKIQHPTRGKINFDLLEAREKNKVDDVIFVRIEELYPFPVKSLTKAIKI